jgi:tRNA threonylcarbamoyl adenosine modification protein YeaZ
LEPDVTRTVLTIDTATPAVSAGVVRLADDGTPATLAERVTIDARAHAEQLTPNIVAALADAGVTGGDLDAVVVGSGPGPFTGLRVGMASAAAFAHAVGVPVHGVCSLDAIGGGSRGDVLVVTDARRREVYWARYREGVRVTGPSVNAPADVPGLLDGPVTAVAGSAAHTALFDLPVLEQVYPTPAGLVAAVADWDSPEPLVPLYLRRPDATPSVAVRR